MTRQQRMTLLKWGTYVMTGVLLLVIQDVIMSEMRISGATTDLPVAFILLVGLYEGLENGSVFTLVAALFYWFSGSAPTPVCVGILCVLNIFIGLFRQMYWHRSKGSILMCTMIALTVYEMSLFFTGLVQDLTIFSRIGSFVLTSIYSCLALIPLYSLIYKIGLIGGNTWKE